MQIRGYEREVRKNVAEGGVRFAGDGNAYGEGFGKAYAILGKGIEQAGGLIEGVAAAMGGKSGPKDPAAGNDTTDNLFDPPPDINSPAPDPQADQDKEAARVLQGESKYDNWLKAVFGKENLTAGSFNMQDYFDQTQKSTDDLIKELGFTSPRGEEIFRERAGMRSRLYLKNLSDLKQTEYDEKNQNTFTTLTGANADIATNFGTTAALKKSIQENTIAAFGSFYGKDDAFKREAADAANRAVTNSFIDKQLKKGEYQKALQTLDDLQGFLPEKVLLDKRKWVQEIKDTADRQTLVGNKLKELNWDEDQITHWLAVEGDKKLEAEGQRQIAEYRARQEKQLEAEAGCIASAMSKGGYLRTIGLFDRINLDEKGKDKLRALVDNYYNPSADGNAKTDDIKTMADMEEKLYSGKLTAKEVLESLGLTQATKKEYLARIKEAQPLNGEQQGWYKIALPGLDGNSLTEDEYATAKRIFIENMPYVKSRREAVELAGDVMAVLGRRDVAIPKNGFMPYDIAVKKVDHTLGGGDVATDVNASMGGGANDDSIQHYSSNNTMDSDFLTPEEVLAKVPDQQPAGENTAVLVDKGAPENDGGKEQKDDNGWTLTGTVEGKEEKPKEGSSTKTLEKKEDSLPSSDERHLGYLSAKEETSKFNSGEVSNGDGDPGGVSYGIYQFNTRDKIINAFVGWLDKQPEGSKEKEYANILGKDVGSEQFKENWRKLGQDDKEGFGNAQFKYVVKEDQYKISLDELKNMDGDFDVKSRSFALQQVLFANAVHHGPYHGARPFTAAAEQAGKKLRDMTDEEIINGIYAWKSDFDNGYMTEDTKDSIKARFERERLEALRLLQKERKDKAGS